MAQDVDPKVIAAISAAVFAWLQSQGLDGSAWRVAGVRRDTEVGDE